LNSSGNLAGERTSSKRFAKLPLFTGGLVIFYLSLLVFFIYLLLKFRTPTTEAMWTLFNPSYLSVFFAMTFLLLLLIAEKGKSSLKLVLIVSLSVVANIFFVTLYETRYGFDNWIGAWGARGAYTGEVLQWNLFSPLPFSPTNLAIILFHAMQMVLSPYVSALLSRMFFIDLYWIHLLFVPVIWGIAVPVIAYGISEQICKGERTHLMAALLTVAIPILVAWGARTVSQSFAFILYFLGVYLLIRYLRGKLNVGWVLFVVFMASLEHAVVGLIFLSMVIIAYFYKKYQTGETTRQKLIFWSAYIISIFPLILSLYARRWTTYPQIGGTFSLVPLTRLTGYDAFLQLIFGDYASMKFSDAFVQGIVSLVGLIALVYVVLNKHEPSYNKNLSRFLLLIFVLILIEYEIVKNFMVNIPFGPGRILTLKDFLAVPFFPAAMVAVLNFLSKGEPVGKAIKSSISLSLIRGAFVKFVSILSIAALVTAAVYVAYPPGSGVFVTGYELEAVKYVEATTRERYVVICQESVAWAGATIVGLANPRAFYTPAYGPAPGYAPPVPTSGPGSLYELYGKMIEVPSVLYLYRAKQMNNATVVYLILTRSKLGATADEIFGAVEELPYVELYGVFGNDTHVYAARLPSLPVTGGEGPSVYVYNLGKYVNTTYVFDIPTSNANYTLVLEGASSYNVTQWPAYWSFEKIIPTPLDMQIDANSWINFTARPEQAYQVLWSANEIYRNVGWRDDSFRTGWNEYLNYGKWQDDTHPTVVTDGDILNITGLFIKGARGVYLISKNVENVSTDEYPYLLIKWRSTSTCAYAWIGVTSGEGQMILYFASYSPDWTTEIIKLSPGNFVDKFIVGLDNFVKEENTSGANSIQIDFIFLASKV